uniref:B9 domain-containing protein 1 n=1 Tax=Globodera pallida TaxID=36090 RepID=A0A183BWR8_GLOPA
MEQLVQNRKENCFLLMVTGQIETVEFISLSNVYCKYFFVYGADWRQVGGPEEGITPTGYKRAKGSRITLSTPIESTFSSTNPFNCGPKLCSAFMDVIYLGTTSCVAIPLLIYPPFPEAQNESVQFSYHKRLQQYSDCSVCSLVVELNSSTRKLLQWLREEMVNELLGLKSSKDSKKFGYELSHQMVSKISEFPLGLPPTENTVSSKNSKPTVTKEKTTETAQEHEEQQLHMLQPQSHVQIKHE